MRVVGKAFAYITNGGRLLVFEHADFPEAGLQVPAGTILPGEPPDTAVVREAREETGLGAFSAVEFIGTSEFDARRMGKEEMHLRHFFHLPVVAPVPERWRHHERDGSDGAREPIAFDLYWLPMSIAAARLIADHGQLIAALRDVLPEP
ncbi:NUDIX hydrolase [Sorangium sp. So ce426]|uniref:NUDIX hydrolase n=1 Tax=Sorangium sp. So ce426 TaxID=3133312 RepID=UPI003F5BF580